MLYILILQIQNHVYSGEASIKSDEFNELFRQPISQLINILELGKIDMLLASGSCNTCVAMEYLYHSSISKLFVCCSSYYE